MVIEKVTAEGLNMLSELKNTGANNHIHKEQHRNLF